MPRVPSPAKDQVNTWQEKLAAQAQVALETEKSASMGSAWISFKNGQISIDDAPVPNNELDVVVLDHIIERQWYTHDFDPKVAATPGCFAFGRDSKTLCPHDSSPEKQSAACVGCAKDEWGSATRGKGKACKEVRRLALMVAGEVAEAATAEVRLAKIPITSCPEWSGYVRHLGEVLHLPPCAVVTRISTEQTPNSKAPFVVRFKFVEPIPGNRLGEIFARQERIQDDLVRPYEPVTEAPPAQPNPKLRGRK